MNCYNKMYSAGSNKRRHPFQPAFARTAVYGFFVLAFIAIIMYPGCQDGKNELVLASDGSCDYQVILPERHDEALGRVRWRAADDDPPIGYLCQSKRVGITRGLSEGIEAGRGEVF